MKIGGSKSYVRGQPPIEVVMANTQGEHSKYEVTPSDPHILMCPSVFSTDPPIANEFEVYHEVGGKWERIDIS